MKKPQQGYLVDLIRDLRPLRWYSLCHLDIVCLRIVAEAGSRSGDRLSSVFSSEQPRQCVSGPCVEVRRAAFLNSAFFTRNQFLQSRYLSFSLSDCPCPTADVTQELCAGVDQCQVSLFALLII